jgi:hypothetical protein
VKKDPRWGAWSEKALAQAVDTGPIAINQLIYAEVSVAYERREQLDTLLDAFEVAKRFSRGRPFWCIVGAAATRPLPCRTSTSAPMRCWRA